MVFNLVRDGGKDLEGRLQTLIRAEDGIVGQPPTGYSLYLRESQNDFRRVILTLVGLGILAFLDAYLPLLRRYITRSIVFTSYLLSLLILAYTWKNSRSAGSVRGSLAHASNRSSPKHWIFIEGLIALQTFAGSLMDFLLMKAYLPSLDNPGYGLWPWALCEVLLLPVFLWNYWNAPLPSMNDVLPFSEMRLGSRNNIYVIPDRTLYRNWTGSTFNSIFIGNPVLLSSCWMFLSTFLPLSLGIMSDLGLEALEYRFGLYFE